MKLEEPTDVLLVLALIVVGIPCLCLLVAAYCSPPSSDNKIVLDGNIWKCTAENTYTQTQYIQVGNISTPSIITVSECVAYAKR